MANPYYALRRIRRTRRSLPTPPDPRFEGHRDEYRGILEAVHRLAGEAAVDDLSGWIIVETARDGQLPVPETVRERARYLLAANGVAIPDDSILAA